LVVVLGHTQCGAIEATLEAMRQPGGVGSRNLSSIVDRVRPAIAPLVEEGGDAPNLVGRAVRANVAASVAHLRHGSDILDSLVRTDGLRIVGAEYSLESGVVEFFADA
jgi:carbonic anhydrase